MSTRETVSTEAAPQPFQGAPYSQAIKAGGFVFVSGQLALGLSEALVAAAVWEQLPPERQREVTIQLARLLARLMEAERDE